MSYTFQPDRLDVHIPLNNLDLGNAFQLSSFSISGRVLHERTQGGIEGVKVSVNGHHRGACIQTIVSYKGSVATTDASGSYVLTGIGAEPFDLLFSKKGLSFEEQKSVKVCREHRHCDPFTVDSSLLSNTSSLLSIRMATQSVDLSLGKRKQNRHPL